MWPWAAHAAFRLSHKRGSTGWLYCAGHGSDPAALATPVGNAMIRYLVQFAATGDPNAGVAGACYRR